MRITNVPIHFMILMLLLGPANWKPLVRPRMPYSSSALSWLGLLGAPFVSSTVDRVDMDPRGTPPLRASCMATRKTFETARSVFGFDAVAKASLILSCNASKLEEKSAPISSQN